jgi:serine/threonine-protein kinase
MTDPKDPLDLKDHRIGPDGRYLIVGRLGDVATADRGGWSDVYLAKDLVLGERRVVAKFLRSDLWHDEGLVRRFDREIGRQVAAGLVHTHVVRVLDAGSFRGRTFCILEHMSGGSLEAKITRGGARADGTPIRRAVLQSAREVAAWLSPIASALDAVHRQGVVHRDVKPANVLFSGDGTPFLSDFGIAKAAMGGAGEEVTATGISLYTPGYESPEMARGKKAVYACDRYALAVVVYRALSGRLPHASDGVRDDRDPWAALRYRRATAPAEPLRAVAPQVPARVAAVVMRALAPDAASRPRSCGEFARDFVAAATSTSDAASDDPGRTGPDEPDIEVLEVGPEPASQGPAGSRRGRPRPPSDEARGPGEVREGPTPTAYVLVGIGVAAPAAAAVALTSAEVVDAVGKTFSAAGLALCFALAALAASGLQWVRVDARGVVSRRWTGARSMVWADIAGVRKRIDERNGQVGYQVVGRDGVRPIGIGVALRDRDRVARQIAERTRMLGTW